ncbi:type II toxin-antitoxin system RelE/ParE family toxin [Mesorhizobium xinjiangense]|uniref:type II toxin-antitoxin system RelE/ParE family toxin n=1 Tax=Mesorhizobium xinjiangense TaxID=2678685 RepID=UPI0012ECD782|nr:type II toxin-antitoxin system RelE/ParE family toxin [Mesorhizobium xinjiangense]
MRLRLTRQADADIENILRETLLSFGAGQVRAYASLIGRGLDMIAEDPMRPSSRERPDIAAGIRSFHLGLAAGRSAAAAHHLYYKTMTDGEAGQDIVVLRILHERMEPKRRVLKSIGPNDTMKKGREGR